MPARFVAFFAVSVARGRTLCVCAGDRATDSLDGGNEELSVSTTSWLEVFDPSTICSSIVDVPLEKVTLDDGRDTSFTNSVGLFKSTFCLEDVDGDNSCEPVSAQSLADFFWSIGLVEEGFGVGVSIMANDIVAGVYTGCVLHLVHWAMRR